jgi:hypothetical protein
MYMDERAVILHKRGENGEVDGIRVHPGVCRIGGTEQLHQQRFAKDEIATARRPVHGAQHCLAAVVDEVAVVAKDDRVGHQRRSHKGAVCFCTGQLSYIERRQLFPDAGAQQPPRTLREIQYWTQAAKHGLAVAVLILCLLAVAVDGG